MNQSHSACDSIAVDTIAQTTFVRRVVGKIFASTNQSLEQEGRLDQIGAVVLAPEWDRLTGAAIDEMRKHAVVARRAFQEIKHPCSRPNTVSLAKIKTPLRLPECAPH